MCADEHTQFLVARCLYSVQTACMGPLIHMCNIKLQINKGLVFKLFVASGEQVCGAITVKAG